MVTSGLVQFDDAGDGQVGITALDDESQLWAEPSMMEGGDGVLDPFLAGTNWTHDDIRTLSSLATLLVALVALWEVARG